MPIRVSTGFRGLTMSLYGVQELMNYGVIKVYAGTQPDSADDAPTGAHLGTITQDGLSFFHGSLTGGLSVYMDSMGELKKQGTWTYKGVSSGTIGWFRWSANLPNDTGEAGTEFVRVDGSVPLNLNTGGVYDVQADTEFNINDFRFIMYPQEY